MGTCPDAIKRLIDRFTQQADTIRSPDYNETLIRIDFINPLMTELGWDLDNRQGFAEQYREVVHEDRVKVAGQTKAPDYSFRVGGSRKFFLEAKKPAVDIRNNWEPPVSSRRERSHNGDFRRALLNGSVPQRPVRFQMSN